MKNFTSGRAASSHDPAAKIIQVLPSDLADLPDGETRALYVGKAGIVSVIDRYGNYAEIVSNACQYHPIRVTRVLASGTTAAAILALY